jgi:alkanesulfonate monooxygenase SsuD/methylene tetrahydromethanopterin reductase-like flavin-dependent oxidoreductase (luciferase family)
VKSGFFHTPYHRPNRPARPLFDWSLRLAVETDKVGFADFMIGEHYCLGWENIPAPEVVIGAAAPITKNIRFAPMAHLLPYHNPATLAIHVGWLSRVLEGRYFLGVAPGGHPVDGILHGITDISTSPDQMGEAIEIMEKVWAREPFRFEGKYFKGGFPAVSDMVGYELEFSDNSPWGGRQNLEVAVTGLSANSTSMKFAGERNYSPISFFGGFAQIRRHWDTWKAAAESKGFLADRSRYRVCRDIFIADSDAEARRRAINSGLGVSWEHYLGSIYKKFGLFQGIIDDSGTGIDVSQVDVDFLADHVWLCGSPETVKRKLERMVEMTGGFGEIVVNSHDNIDDPEPFIESLQRLATEVVPKIGSF